MSQIYQGDYPLAAPSQAKAKAALARMRTSLRGWLKYRAMNDKAGVTPADLAARTAEEPVIAEKLHALLHQMYGDVSLPTDAVSLAKIAVGEAPVTTSSPDVQGFIPLIIGAIAIVWVLTSMVSNWADVAKERERIACIEKGACTDYGFWLKWGAITGGVYVLWRAGILGNFRRMITGRRR